MDEAIQQILGAGFRSPSRLDEAPRKRDWVRVGLELVEQPYIARKFWGGETGFWGGEIHRSDTYGRIWLVLLSTK